MTAFGSIMLVGLVGSLYGATKMARVSIFIAVLEHMVHLCFKCILNNYIDHFYYCYRLNICRVSRTKWEQQHASLFYSHRARLHYNSIDKQTMIFFSTIRASRINLWDVFLFDSRHVVWPFILAMPFFSENVRGKKQWIKSVRTVGRPNCG